MGEILWRQWGHRGVKPGQANLNGGKTDCKSLEKSAENIIKTSIKRIIRLFQTTMNRQKANTSQRKRQNANDVSWKRKKFLEMVGIGDHKTSSIRTKSEKRNGYIFWV